MKSSPKMLSVSLGLVLLTTVMSTAQTPAEPEKEFRSIGGRFGILLPQNYSDYKAAVPLEVSSQKFLVSIYRWSTAAGQFSVSYGIGNVNLEAPEQASKFLVDFRVQILGHSEKESRLLGERQTSLDGHPGIEIVAESSVRRRYASPSRIADSLPSSIGVAIFSSIRIWAARSILYSSPSGNTTRLGACWAL